MTNISGTNFTSHLKDSSTEDEEWRTAITNAVIAMIINSITCPFTVLLNLSVIMAVRRRPRLQSKTNILLAYLAATDVLTGLVVQPSFILFKTLEILGVPFYDLVRQFHNSCLRAVSICSSLHLMLVTFERLIAIKFTMQYTYVVTRRNIKAAVISFWIFVMFYESARLILNTLQSYFNLLVAFVLLSCIVFVLFSYVNLYRETLRHRKRMKTQQLPAAEVERFAKENKALKTTVLLVGAVTTCYLPISLGVLHSQIRLLSPHSVSDSTPCMACPWVRTFVMLNSLFNPLIYCCRQKEMRQFVFRFSPQAVAPQSDSTTPATNC
ncbi:melanocortin receptor 5-like [Montipora foliosa]|uniref:melanocortin receptor 5-like n=1 Tax=Montipora foliosa TaxID=591990 RepID=UPI0035F1928B